jgi:AcrR family transcriptional regulator
VAIARSTADARHATDRRTRILAGALDCFQRKGYGATTIEDVRRQSGASIGSIYHHFDGKEDIAARLYVEGLTTYQQGSLRSLARARTARTTIAAAVGFHLDWIAGHRQLARYLMSHREPEIVLRTQAAIRAANREFFAGVRAIMAPHMESRRIRRVPFDVLNALVLGGANEFAHHWLAGATDTPLPEARRTLVAGAWAAIKGDAA